MRKNDFRTISIVVAFGFIIFISACSDNKSQDTPSPQSAVNQTPTQTTPPSAGQSLPAEDGGKCNALMTAKCTECHNMTRVCEKLGKKSKTRWNRTITRMTERGAKLNAEEAAVLLVCLDSGVKNLQSSCR